MYNNHPVAGLYDHCAVRDMLKECVKMYKFNHVNILTLKGVCLDGGPAPYIVMPFMVNGSLLAYLKDNRHKLVVCFKDKDEEDVRNDPFSWVPPILSACIHICT